jgi:hypothetical protein
MSDLFIVIHKWMHELNEWILLMKNEKLCSTCTEQSLAWLCDIKPTASKTCLAETWNKYLYCKLGWRRYSCRRFRVKVGFPSNVIKSLRCSSPRLKGSVFLSSLRRTTDPSRKWQFNDLLGINNKNKREREAKERSPPSTLSATLSWIHIFSLTLLENCLFSRNPSGVPSSYGYTHFCNPIINLFVGNTVFSTKHQSSLPKQQGATLKAWPYRRSDQSRLSKDFLLVFVCLYGML